MIEISRALLRQFRTVVRRSLMDADRRGAWPAVVCRADRKGLSLEAFQGDIAVRHRRDGAYPSEVIPFPGRLLAELEGRADQPVRLTIMGPGKGGASWLDGAVPKVVEFDMAAPDNLPTLPEMPKDFGELPHDFLLALGEAGRSAGKEAVRYGLTHVQLRGRACQIVATDGKQLLVQGGFPFPWTEDVLVPRLSVFGCREVAFEEPVRIGRAEEIVLLETGPWTFWLRVDKDHRFPKIEHVVPSESAIQSRLHVHPEDGAFLAATLPKLPVSEDDHLPVTLDLSTPPVVRAQGGRGAPLTEVVLARSTVSGKSVRVNLDRRQLHRALKLGFGVIHIVAADTAIAFRDASRVYVVMPLNSEGALAPAANSLRIASEEGEVAPPTLAPERSIPTMPAPQSQGNGAENHGRSEAPANGLIELIAEAESLRDMLHEAAGRTARLVAALKQQRRQTRAVQQAMASLRQLQLDR